MTIDCGDPPRSIATRRVQIPRAGRWVVVGCADKGAFIDTSRELGSYSWYPDLRQPNPERMEPLKCHDARPERSWTHWASTACRTCHCQLSSWRCATPNQTDIPFPPDPGPSSLILRRSIPSKPFDGWMIDGCPPESRLTILYLRDMLQPSHPTYPGPCSYPNPILPAQWHLSFLLDGNRELAGGSWPVA